MVRIVSVDDDPVFQTMLSEMLALEGWTVDTLNDETTAFERLKGNPPDLVILDVRMGSADGGWRLLQKLHGDGTTRPIPLIVCSAASSFLRDKEQQLHALGIEIVLKPFDIDHLHDCVRRGLSRETPPTQ